jgi:hypothetical protein
MFRSLFTYMLAVAIISFFWNDYYFRGQENAKVLNNSRIIFHWNM